MFRSQSTARTVHLQVMLPASERKKKNIEINFFLVLIRLQLGVLVSLFITFLLNYVRSIKCNHFNHCVSFDLCTFAKSCKC